MGEVDVKGLVAKLRQFEQAYSEQFFRPLSKAEQLEIGPVLLSRASADMGRHLAQFFTQAADAIEKLDSEVERRREAMNHCRAAFAGMVSIQSAIDLLDAEPKEQSPE